MKLIIACGLNGNRFISAFRSLFTATKGNVELVDSFQSLQSRLSAKAGGSGSVGADSTLVYIQEDWQADLPVAELAKINEQQPLTYALFYSAPEYGALSAAASLADEVDAWLAANNQLFETYMANMGSAFMFNSESLLNRGKEVLAVLANEIPNLQAEGSQHTNSTALPLTDVAACYARTVELEYFPAAQLLLEQLESASAIETDVAEAQLKARVKKWQQLLLNTASENTAAKTALEQSASDLQTRITELSSEGELSALQINQLQEELEQAGSKLKSQQKQLSSAEDELAQKAAEYNAVKAALAEQAERNKDLTNESELSLLQINQLQEELEQQVSKLISLEQASKQAQESLAQKEAENASIKQEASQLKGEHQNLAAENELLLLQINQLQQELETSVLEASKQKDHAAKADEASQKALSELNKANAAAETLQTQVAELTAENELSMLQINQLQEELEFYYGKLHEQGTWRQLPLRSAPAGLRLKNSVALLSKLKH
ncbi:hypothetical protein [Reinekea marinisedimentorum]|uniref:Uncharacterized protein n=1 Tax=Reinekea marinisedimentorum TaxID=230495 RepID=A0A4R3I9A1_9GAMM|nr:hypothetical protein [Reinekea marinisedimentorum]TCS41952.1 hypothetical protein BCF53_10456 [Reinekea marinisedimentorum]